MAEPVCKWCGVAKDRAEPRPCIDGRRDCVYVEPAPVPAVPDDAVTCPECKNRFLQPFVCVTCASHAAEARADAAERALAEARKELAGVYERVRGHAERHRECERKANDWIAGSQFMSAVNALYDAVPAAFSRPAVSDAQEGGEHGE